MEAKILVSEEAYKVLHRDSREALYRLGIASNPAFTDHNIITSLSLVLGVEVPEPYEERSEFSGEIFRDNLASILGIELPASISEIREGLALLQMS